MERTPEKFLLTLRIETPTSKGMVAYEYTVTRLPADNTFADAALRLTKADGTTYDIHADGGWLECECEDFVARQRVCKHLRAIVETGLIETRSNRRLPCQL